MPAITTICLSQYGDRELIQAAVHAGANAILLKNDVRLAIATAVVRAYKAPFTYTPGVIAALSGQFDDLLVKGGCLLRWQLHPELAPHLLKVLWLSLVYGMSAAETAEELTLTEATVERYRTQIIDILADGWLDEADLAGWDQKLTRHLPGDKYGRSRIVRGAHWAFHMLTQLPRKRLLNA